MQPASAKHLCSSERQKETHKKRSIEFKAENLELKEQNLIYANEYNKLKQLYYDAKKDLENLKARQTNKKIHKINDINDISIIALDDEIKQADEEAKKTHENKRKDNMQNFMKQFI